MALSPLSLKIRLTDNKYYKADNDATATWYKMCLVKADIPEPKQIKPHKLLLFTFLIISDWIKKSFHFFSNEDYNTCLKLLHVLDGAAQAAVSQLQPFLIQLSCMAHCQGLFKGAACTGRMRRVDELQWSLQNKNTYVLTKSPHCRMLEIKISKRKNSKRKSENQPNQPN